MESQNEVQTIDIVVVAPTGPNRDVVSEPWARLDKIIVDMSMIMTLDTQFISMVRVTCGIVAFNHIFASKRYVRNLNTSGS